MKKLANELREKSIAELEKELLEVRKEQFNLRMQKGSQQLAQIHRLRQTRRNIAQIKTVLHEKQMVGDKA